MRNTFFLDLDGTLVQHLEDFELVHETNFLPVLPGAKEQTNKWHCNGDMIIITTARPESIRKLTETQLQNAGIVYDLLIMGIGAGDRILVNDKSESGRNKAFAFNVERNKDGVKDITMWDDIKAR